MFRSLLSAAAMVSVILFVAALACAVVQRHCSSYAELLHIRAPAPVHEALFVWDGPSNSLLVLWDPLVPGEYGPSKSVAIHAWIVFTSLAILPLVRIALFVWHRKRRPSTTRCARCSYDLTGNISGICPECGTKVPANSIASRR